MKYSELKKAYKAGVLDCVSPYSENRNPYPCEHPKPQTWYFYNIAFNKQFKKLTYGKTWAEIDDENKTQMTFF